MSAEAGFTIQKGVAARPVLMAHQALSLDGVHFDVAQNGTLRKDQWETVDSAVGMVLSERLTVLDLWRSRGLVQPVGIGDLYRVSEHELDWVEATRHMDGDARITGDRAAYGQTTIAVPMHSHGFHYGFRKLAAQSDLDTTSAQTATRKVRQSIQDLITNGGTVAGNVIPGLTTAPNKIDNTHASWITGTPNPVGDVNAMLQKAYAKFLFGPFALMIPNDYWAKVQEDYKAETQDTYLQRFQSFADIVAVMPNDALPAGNLVLQQLTSDVADYSEALAPQAVQWQKNPNVTQFRVHAIGGPQIKTLRTQGGEDINGIVHSTPT